MNFNYVVVVSAVEDLVLFAGILKCFGIMMTNDVILSNRIVVISAVYKVRIYKFEISF